MGRNVESLQTDKRKDRLISEMQLKKSLLVFQVRQANEAMVLLAYLVLVAQGRVVCIGKGLSRYSILKFILLVSCLIRAFNGAFNRFLGHSDVLSIAIRR